MPASSSARSPPIAPSVQGADEDSGLSRWTQSDSHDEGGEQMKKHALLLGAVLAIAATGWLTAGVETPAPIQGSSCTAASPTPDPYLGMEEVSTEVTERAVCPCAPGINCCGDSQVDPTGRAQRCGANWSCRCNAGGTCIT